MHVRLAFAVAIQVDAEILLIDEVLAVGDAAFQQKCFDEFNRLKSEGRTILFVTHDMGAVERFCDRALLLEHGRVVDIGAPPSIARQYNELNFRRKGGERDASAGAGPAVPPGAFAEVLGAWFESAQGEVMVTAVQGDACCVRMDVRFLREADDPVFAIALQNEGGQVVFATSSQLQQVTSGPFPPGATAKVRIAFDQWLAPGRYTLMVSVARAGLEISDLRMNNSLIVLPNRPGGGIADLPHSFEVERD
jgi:hypothetical protein